MRQDCQGRKDGKGCQGCRGCPGCKGSGIWGHGRHVPESALKSGRLRMGYFAKFADPYFLSNAENERIFRWWPSRARAYMVPDAETESRLRLRSGVAHTLSTALIIVPTAFGAAFLLNAPWMIVALMLLEAALVLCARWLILAPELRRLQPARAGAVLPQSWKASADRLTHAQLVANLLLCLAFVAICALVWRFEPRLWPACLVPLLFFVPCAAWHGYLLVRKSRSNRG